MQITPCFWGDEPGGSDKKPTEIVKEEPSESVRALFRLPHAVALS